MNTTNIPSHMHGKWYVTKDTVIELTKSDDFDIIEFCKTYSELKNNETLREISGEETWNGLQEAFDGLNMITTTAVFDIYSEHVGSDVPTMQSLNIVSVSTEGNETTLIVESTNEEGGIEKNILTKSETDQFITFTDSSKTGTLGTNPVDLISDIN
jgi:hypothetical protein